MTQLKIKYVPLQQLQPYHNNPQLHPPEQVTRLAQMIDRFGFDVPIVVDEDWVILKGHGRRLAALELQLDQVPTIQRTGLSDTDKRAMRIADNKIQEYASTDLTALKVEMVELGDLHYDLELTGFSLESIGTLLDPGVTSYQPVNGDHYTDQQTNAQPPGLPSDRTDVQQAQVEDDNAANGDAPTPPEPEKRKSDGSLLATTQVTIDEPQHQVANLDVWKLGPHTLLCCDVVKNWDVWQHYLTGDPSKTLFVPYPGVFVAISSKAADYELIMVQPDKYVAGHILDNYAAAGGDVEQIN